MNASSLSLAGSILANSGMLRRTSTSFCKGHRRAPPPPSGCRGQLAHLGPAPRPVAERARGARRGPPPSPAPGRSGRPSRPAGAPRSASASASRWSSASRTLSCSCGSRVPTGSWRIMTSGRFRTARASASFCRCGGDSRAPPTPQGASRPTASRARADRAGPAPRRSAREMRAAAPGPGRRRSCRR